LHFDALDWIPSCVEISSIDRHQRSDPTSDRTLIMFDHKAQMSIIASH